MTNPTNPLLAALERIANNDVPRGSDGRDAPSVPYAIQRYAREALSSAPAVGEAVAWMYDHPDYAAYGIKPVVQLERADPEKVKDGWIETPLGKITHPPADAAAVAGEEAWVRLLTKAVGDITAALILAGKQDKLKAWTAPYVAGINEFDARPVAEDRGWCPACGCGNDKSGYAHLETCRIAHPAPDEPTGELLDRAELAWQRFFYPARDCFSGDTADLKPSVGLEMADCLRLTLAAFGRNVSDPNGGTVPAPAEPVRLREDQIEVAALAFAKEFYGPGFDPFHNPEAYDMAEKATRAALSTLTRTDKAQS